MPTVLGLTNDSRTAPAAPGTSNNKMGGGENSNKKHDRLNTISKRNHAAAHEVETLLWRALCDSPEAAKEYMAEDCIMINPLFAPGGSTEPMGKDTDPSVEDVLAGGEPWAGFRFHGEPLVVEIDLMAVALVYKVSLFRQSSKKNGGMREIVASVSSAWRQTAGADWLLCAQHVAYADDDE
ncbi:hypothetical protein B0T26DRAFT_790561 [Lasiosphaeria miniovina]|uniref:DUF4440 domain-containing protein n=1 Tax=Lasiosphaeria miniovina TaxID=1954250 RepID=A0AA40A0G2_9PEZI|nr:uncharacterized protein B0T26DRAFT_790561 [Lasiosphaeria miniovina]KAK0706993.1 hypothetical protein B0T26DRAFT_790561 [Lasiosphaeria miniovina]